MKDEPYSLPEVADRLAIADIINRYVHALDARQFDILDDVFLPHCTFDLRSAGGPVTTWQEVKPYYSSNQTGGFPHYLHVFVNPVINFGPDRTTAHSVFKVINPTGRIGDDGRMHHFDMYGHYHDDWLRTTDGWRIAARRWENLWIAGDYPFAQLPGDFEGGDRIGEQSEHVAMYVHGAFDGRVRIAPEVDSIRFW